MSTDVAQRSDFPALAQAIVEIGTEAQNNQMFTTDQNRDFVHGVLENILNAESWDDIFEAQDSGMQSGKDFVGIPFLIASAADIEWRTSTKGDTSQGAFPYFAVITATELQTGEPVTFGCGATTFCVALHQLKKRGYFDDQPEEGRALVIQEHPTDEGRSYLTIRPYKQPERGKRRAK